MKIFVNHVWYSVPPSYQDLIEEIGEDEFRIEGVDTEGNIAHDQIFGTLGEDFDLEEVCKALALFEEHDENMIAAYLNCFNAEDSIEETIQKAEEAYQGSFADDEEFAEDLAEQCGMIDKDLSWPNNCIDWEKAARELMYDYTEDNHYYFRNV